MSEFRSTTTQHAAQAPYTLAYDQLIPHLTSRKDYRAAALMRAAATEAKDDWRSPDQHPLHAVWVALGTVLFLVLAVGLFSVAFFLSHLDNGPFKSVPSKDQATQTTPSEEPPAANDWSRIGAISVSGRVMQASGSRIDTGRTKRLSSR